MTVSSVRVSLVLVALLSTLSGCTNDPALARLGSSVIPKIETPHTVNLDSLPYPRATFAATHNSYSGARGGDHVAGVREQLERGVRMIELDVHDDDFRRHGFRVGHLRPGSEVFHGDGNPASNRLEDWLGVIAAWSNANPKHAPVTLALDLKDEIGDNASFEDGDLTALNDRLVRAFGKKLFWASAVETRAWPTVGELRDRIIVVLSGNEPSRVAYRGDRGQRPAVAMNRRGAVVEVHDDGSGHLAYWSGRYQDDGRVAWARHAVYDTGLNPAVDLNDDGLVVEVHQDPDRNDDQLWYRVGQLGDDLEIRWFHEDGLEFPGSDDGVKPTVRFTSPDATTVREIHESPTTGKRWYWAGAYDASKHTFGWGRPGGSGRTSEPRFPKNRAVAGAHEVEVYTGPDGAFGGDTLLYNTDRVGPARIRPPQLAFVEVQHGSGTQLEKDGLCFYSGSASSLSARLWAIAGRAAGKVARLWGFNDEALTSEASVNFPATDEPFTGWYDGYRRDLAAVR